MGEEKKLDYSKEKLICFIVVFMLMGVYASGIILRTKYIFICSILCFVNSFISKKMGKWYRSFVIGIWIVLLILIFIFKGHFNSYLFCIWFAINYVIDMIYFIVKDDSGYKKLQIVSIILIIPIILSIDYYITKDKLIKDKRLDICIKDNLKENGYNGEISFSQLQNIERLSIYESDDVYNLQGLENLKNLKELYINAEGIKNLNVLEELPNLKQLEVHHCDFNSFKKIKSLKSLEQLDINHFEINGDYILDNMPNLKRLFIRHGYLSNIGVIKNLNTLEELEFYDCEIESLMGIEGLSNLRRLDFQDINMEDKDTQNIRNLEQLDKLPNLKEVNIDRVKAFDFFEKVNFHFLDKLELSFIEIKSDYSIENFKNLRKLSINCIDLKDLSLVKKLSSLEELEIGFCEINSFNGIECLSNLKKFEIKDIKIDGIFVSDYDPIDSIIDELKTCKDTDLNSSTIGKLEQLQELLDNKSSIKENKI